MVEDNIEIENTKTLQYRELRESILNKLCGIEVCDVGSETETLKTLTTIPSFDDDFMQELKLKHIYKVHNEQKLCILCCIPKIFFSSITFIFYRTYYTYYVFF